MPNPTDKPEDETSKRAPACRLVVVGPGVRALVCGEEGFGNYADLVAEHPALEAWTAESAAQADLVVAGCPTLFPETLEKLRARMDSCGAKRAVVVYDFAQGGVVDGARDITALRAPVTPAELRAACEADIAMQTLREHSAEAELEKPLSISEEEIPPRQFSDAQLAEVSQISTAINCECPHHLSTLLMSLNAFETYSRECENRNDEDAILHAYLHRRTARARSVIEEALVVLAEAEGFDLS